MFIYVWEFLMVLLSYGLSKLSFKRKTKQSSMPNLNKFIKDIQQVADEPFKPCG